MFIKAVSGIIDEAIDMKRYIFCLFFVMIFFSAGFVFAQDYPVLYKEDCGLEPWEFFEKEYRTLWNTLSEEEQFAIMCSANTFERNEQYHLDFSNKTLFNKDTTTGKYILNERWDVYSKEELLEADKDLEENGQAVVYRKLEALLEKYPDSSIIEIGEKEELTVNQVSRLYMIQQMHTKLGVHGIDAWDDSRRITILRWGMGAGYLSKAEGLEIIKPIVSRIKNNSTSGFPENVEAKSCSSTLLYSHTNSSNAFLSFLFIGYHLYNFIIDIIVFSNTLSALHIGRIVLSAALTYPSYLAILAQASRFLGDMTISNSSFIIFF